MMKGAVWLFPLHQWMPHAIPFRWTKLILVLLAASLAAAALFVAPLAPSIGRSAPPLQSSPQPLPHSVGVAHHQISLASVLHVPEPVSSPPSPSRASLPSAVDASLYAKCQLSFQHRDHPLNDGVSVRIAMFSMWNQPARRAMWRSLLLPWIPSPPNIHSTCTKYASEEHRSIQQVKPAPNNSVDEQYCGVGSSQVYDYSWWSVYDNVELVFVMGMLRQDDIHFNESVAAMEAEHRQHGDLMILTDMIENMDEGKTLHVLRKHSALNQQKKAHAAEYGYNTTRDLEWDFVMKLDDDSFIHVGHLVSRLRYFRQHRLKEVFYGLYYHGPGNFWVPKNSMAYMSGAGYVLSADLIHWFNSPSSYTIINNTFTYGMGGQPVPLPNINAHGYEDLSLGAWLTERGRYMGRHLSPAWRGFSDDEDEAYRLHHALVLNFWNGADEIYNYPSGDYASHPQFENGTVLIHQLKDMDRINITVRHFLCNHPFTFEWDNRWWYGEGKNVLVNEYDEDGRYVPVSEWWHDTEQLYRWTAPNYTMPVDALEDTDGDDGEARIVKPTQALERLKTRLRQAQVRQASSTAHSQAVEFSVSASGFA